MAHHPSPSTPSTPSSYTLLFLQDVTARNQRAGKASYQWMACDWVSVDEELSAGAEYAQVHSRLMRSESGSFFGDCLAERRVDLCESARVILLFNLDLVR